MLVSRHLDLRRHERLLVVVLELELLLLHLMLNLLLLLLVELLRRELM